MEDYRVQDGYFVWRDVGAYKAYRIGKGARRQKLSLSEYQPSSAQMDISGDVEDSLCSETESILSIGSSASGSRSTNTCWSLSAGGSCDTDDVEFYFPLDNSDSHDGTFDPKAPLISHSESLEIIERAKDDIDIQIRPSRYIDYLSHEWREEDILPSWRYAMSNQKSHANRRRLANAAWRAWEKTRSNLQTVSAESLNWMKDCDVTWLYGPLQTSYYTPVEEFVPSRSQSSRRSSPSPRKPSLKTRSVSEIFQRSLSTPPYLKQAAATIQVRQGDQTSNLWKTTAHHRRKIPILQSFTSSLESKSHYIERNARKVRFQEVVEQYIAVDLARNRRNEDDLRESQPANSNPKFELQLEFTPASKMLIESLPYTLLKSQDEEPKPFPRSLRKSGELFSYSSQETLRTTSYSAQVLPKVDAEDEEEIDRFSPVTSSSNILYDELQFDEQKKTNYVTDNGSFPQNPDLPGRVKSDSERTTTKDEETCSNCMLHTMPSWRNCDTYLHQIRGLTLDDSDSDDPTLVDLSKAIQNREILSITKETTADMALPTLRWLEDAASPTLDDFGPKVSNLASFALPLRFPRETKIDCSVPGNCLPELGDSIPTHDLVSRYVEKSKAESDATSSGASNYCGSDSAETRSDDSNCHYLFDESGGHDKTDLVPILEPMKQALVGRIMEEFWRIFNCDSRFTSCADNTPQSSTPSSVISSLSSSSTRPSQRKRKRDDEDDGRSPNDDDGRKPRQPRNSPMADPEGSRRLACPFRKHDSQKYSVYNYRACALSHWETISRVKEHIYRCHQKAIHCTRCWRVFKNQQQLDSHITVAAADICEVHPRNVPDGITPEIERKLRSRKKSHPNQSEEDRWKEIYRLLFPDEIVPSPYFEPAQEEGRLSPDSRSLANYESYIRRELPRLVRSSIEEIVHREMQPFEASLVGNLVGIIQDCQDRVFRSYRKHEQSTSENMELSVSDSAGVTRRSRSDAVNETGMESDFIDEIFQPAPTANQMSERYVPDPQLFDLFDGPNHMMPSDSGYGSEQLCSCISLCSCNSSTSDDAAPGGEMENRVFEPEQNWYSYPVCNPSDLMDRELDRNGSARM